MSRGQVTAFHRFRIIDKFGPDVQRILPIVPDLLFLRVVQLGGFDPRTSVSYISAARFRIKRHGSQLLHRPSAFTDMPQAMTTMMAPCSATEADNPHAFSADKELREWQQERTRWTTKFDQLTIELEQLREQFEALDRRSAEIRCQPGDGATPPADNSIGNVRTPFTLSPSLWKGDPLSDGDSPPSLPAAGESSGDHTLQAGQAVASANCREGVQPAWLKSRSSQEAEGADASIDEYVMRLLQRVRGPSADPPSDSRVASAAIDSAAAFAAIATAACQAAQPAAAGESPTMGSPSTSLPGTAHAELGEAVAANAEPPAAPRERQHFPEDLSAIRALANQSAQVAIKTFERRAAFEQALVNMAFLVVVLPCLAIFLLGNGMENPAVNRLAVGLGSLVFLVASFRATQLFLRSRA